MEKAIPAMHYKSGIAKLCHNRNGICHTIGTLQTCTYEYVYVYVHICIPFSGTGSL
jgi:hypothetical protein